MNGLNRTFRIIWSRTLKRLVVCGELAKSRGSDSAPTRVVRSSSVVRRFALSILCSALGLASLSSYADPVATELPQGAQIAAGAAAVSVDGSKLTVTQSSDKAIINWNSFNIGAQAEVRFDQPSSSSAVLNRVLAADPSVIQGKLSSNGQVFLINPNGVLFGETARVDVGALVASTLNISDENFLNEHFKFSGNPVGSVVNKGSLTGGFVALIGPEVDNQGYILARVDDVALIAGDSVTLDLDGSSLVAIEVEASKLRTAVKNSGSIEAPEGSVVLTANAAQSLIDDLINTPQQSADELVFIDGVPQLVSNSGTIKAPQIELSAGELGATSVSGTLDVSSDSAVGGTLEVTGKAVLIEETAVLDATGPLGGGEILVGGDWQGTGETLQATYATVEHGAVLDASATANGDGGKVVVWSDIYDPESRTIVAGSLLAKGGPLSGDGGQIETSGHFLNVDHAEGDASSFQGLNGEWLFDPYSFRVVASADGSYTTAGTNYTAINTDTRNQAASMISATTIQTALNNGSNVIVKSVNGSVILETSITSTGSGNLTFSSADNRFTVLLADITLAGGDLLFTSTSGSNASRFAAAFMGNSNQTITTQGGSVTFGGSVLLANGSGLSINTMGSSTAGDLVFVGEVNSANRFTLTSEAKSLTVWKSDSLYNGTSLAVDASYAATLTSLSENALATAVLSIGGYSDTAWFGLEENPAYDGQSSQYRWWAGPEIGDTLGSLNVWGSSEPNNNTVGGLDGAVIGWGDSTGGSYEKWDDQGSSAVHKLLYETNLSNTPLTISAGTGTVVFNSDIGSTRGLGNLTISSAKNVSFKGKVDGAFSLDVDLVSGGSTIFYDTVGGVSPLSTINIGELGKTYLAASTNTTGNQTYTNDLYIGLSFENGDFSSGFSGWSYSNTPVYLGSTEIGGFQSPDDPTATNDTAADRGTFPATGISTTITDGVITMYTGGGSCSVGYCIVRGPYVISDESVYLRLGDSVSFDWRAEGSGDAYDAFGYLLNVSDGSTLTLLNSTGTNTGATNWAPAEFTISSAAQVGDYRFVFVAGSYDLSGGKALGGKLSIDNIKNSAANPNILVSADSFRADKDVFLFSNTLELNTSSLSGIHGTIKGSGELKHNGSDTLILSENNTFTGTTTVGALATLQVGNSSTTGSLVGDVSNDGKVVFDRSDAYEYAGDISGTGEIEKALNTGDLTLSGALSFSGQTAIRSGNLIIENDAAPSHNSEYLGPGSLIVRPKSNDFSSAVSTANWGFNTTNPIANLTIGNSSASADGTSDATVTLGSETVVSGGVWLFGNDVAIAADVTAQTINIKASDSIYINSAMLDTSGVISLVSDFDSSGAGSIEVFSSNLSSGGGNITFSGGSSGTGFAQGTNTEQGTRSIYRGVTFDQSTIDASGTSTGGDILVKGRGLQTGSTDYSLGVELLRDVTIRTNKDGAISIYGEGGAHSGSHFAAGINLHRANEIITEAGAIILDGKAYATGTTSYYGINFDTYASDAANAIYSQSGDITLSGSDGGAGSYGVGVHTNAKPVYLGWDGSGVSPTITSGTLTISGEAINLSSNISVSAADVKFNTASASTFAGTINGISQLTKLGTASLTLSGASSYSGDTNVSAGSLILTHADALGATTGDTNVASGATLDVRGVTLAAEPITLNGGTLATSSGNAVVSGSVTLTANSSISVTGTQLLASGVISGDYALSLSGSGRFVAAAANTFSGALTIASGSTLQIGNGGTSGSLVADVINNGTVQYNRSDSLELTSDISGNGALRQSGSGVLVLTGNNTYTGGTTIDSGSILQIGAGGSGGSISGSIANAGTLEFKRSGSLSYGGIISGTGQVKVTGSGTISLSGANTYTGATYVSGGELRISGDGVLGNGNYTSVLDVSAGASLVFASTANQNVAKLQGAGAFGVSGSGEFTLSGDQSFAGDISVGQLMVLDNGTNNNISGIGNANAITINNGGTIELAGSNNNSFIGSRRSGGPAISILTGGLLTTANDATVRTFHLGTDLTLAGGELGWGPSGSQYVSQWGTWNVNGDIYVTENSKISAIGMTNTNVATTITVPEGKELEITGYFVDAVNQTEYALVKSGLGTLKLTSPNADFSANAGVTGLTDQAVIINQGTVIANSAYAFGDAEGGVSVAQGAVLDLAGVTITGETLTLSGGTLKDATSTWAGDVVLAANSQFDVGAGDTLIISGEVSGAYSVTKSGAGLLTLSGVNTYSGGTIINAGAIQATQDASFGALPTEFDGDNITIDGGALFVDSEVNLLPTRGIAIGANGATFDITENHSLVYTGNISGSSGALVKAGAGRLNLVGTSSYTSGTVVSGGTLGLYVNSAAGTGTIDLAAGVTLLLGRAVSEISNNITLSGSATIDLDTSIDYLVVGGGGGGGAHVGGGGGAGGVLSGTTDFNLTSYSLTVGAGGTGGYHPGSARNDLATPAKNGESSTLGQITALGGGGGGQWTYDQPNSNDGITATQVASGGGSGDNTAGGVGTAGQGFSGGRGDGVATYGYLTGGGGGAGAAGGNYNQASGQGSGDGGVGLYIDWADQLGLGDQGYFGGGGGGGMHTTNANHDPGQGGLGGGGDGAEAVLSSVKTAALANTGGGGGGNGRTNASASRGGDGGSGIIAIRYLGADVSTGGSESSAINGYSTNVFSAIGSSTLTLNSVDVLLSGSISGADNLTLHAEGGKIRLSGDSTFSGDTTVVGGTVEMTGTGVLGEAGVYAGNIDTSGALLFNSSANQTLSGDISGSGSISKSSEAGSVLVLSGSNTYTGTTTVTFGTLRVANGSGLGSAAGATTVGSDAVLELTGVDIGSEALTIAGGALVATGGASSASGTVALSASTAIRVDSSSLTLSGSISGTGYGLTKLGSGELILSAANTYTGTTTVSAGTLTLSNAFALGNSASGTLIEAGSTLDLNNLTLVGEALTLNGGTLSAASGSSVIASPITLTADSTIEVSGTELSISGGIAGGNFGVTKTGTGALVLSGANTYSGDTTVSAGTLQLGDNSSTGAINNSSIINNASMVLDFSQDIQISSDITGSGTLAITPRYSLLKDWGASSSLSNTSYEVVATNSSVAEVLNRVTGGLLHGSATGQPINGGAAGVNNKVYDPATNTASFFVTYHDAVYAKRVKVLLRQNGATVEAKVDSTIAEYQQHNNTTAYSGADLIAENHTFDFTGQMGYATSYTAGGYGLRALDQSVQVTLLGDVQLDGAITLGEAEYTSDASLYKDLRFTKASIAVGSSGSLNLNSLGISETSDLSEPGFAIRNDGVIDFDLTSDWLFDAVITGSGSIKKNGSGLLSLTGTNFYTGQTLVSEGTVSIGSAQSISPAYSAIGVGSLRIASGATLDLFGHSLSNNLVTLGGSIVNSGTSNVSISGAITLEGDATISSLGGGELTLASTVDGPYSLTISTNSASTDAHLTLSGSLGQTTALSGLYADTGSAPTLINSAISTTGEIEFLSGALAVSANIETTGGDLTLKGDSGSATATGLDGVNIGNVEIKTLGSGDISILGRSGNGNIDGLIGVEVSGGGAVISSAGALTITGRSESLSSSVTRGVWVKGQLSSVGDMIINGTANSNNNYDVSLQDASLTTQAGSISLHANNAAGRISTAGTVTISAGASEDIKLYANVHRTSSAGASINTSGIVSIQAKTGSSSFAEVFDTGVYNYASTVTNLALGGASNGSPLSVTETISIAGPISFTGSDISVDAGVVTTNSNVIFNATGTVTQGVNGYLESSGLALKGTGDFALESAQNSIITLAAGNDDLSAIGSLSFTNNGALTIASVNPTGITASGNVSISATDLSVTEAIDVGTNTLTLTLSGAGSDSSNGKLIAKSLLLNGTGSYTFDGSSNDVDTLAANSGAITFWDSDDLTIESVVSTTGLTSTGAIVLTTGTSFDINAAITATDAIVLTSGTSLNIDDAIDTAGTLTATAGTSLDISASIATTGAQRYSATTYTLSDNTQTLSSDDTLSFLGSGALSLGGTGAGWSLDTALLNASTSANGLYVGDANTTDIVIESAVSVTNASATETLILTGTGNLTQSASLSANKLALVLGGDATLTNSSNSIGTFAATLANLSLTNSGALTIASVNPTGITASGNVSISATDLSVTEAIDVGTNTLTLTLSGAGSDSSNGKLIAKSLLLNGTGSYTFDGSSNDVDTLAANSGAITFWDSDDLTIESVGGTTGLTSTGAIVLTSGTTLDINAAITATDAIVLTSGTSLNIDDAIDTAGTLTAKAVTRLDINASITTTGAQRYSATTYTLSDNTQTLSSDDTLSFLGSGALSLGGTGAGWSLDTALLNASTSANGLYVGDANTTDIVIESAVSVTNASATETLILTGTGNLTQSASLSANKLALVLGGDATLTNSSNSIGTFVATLKNLSLTNSGALTIGSVNPTGITASGNVSISATDLSVTEAIDVGTNTLTLTLSGAGSDSSNGKLIAKSLLLNGTGSYTFDGSSNDVDTLAANSGAITFGDSDDLTIGSVGGTTGLTSTGAIVLTSGTSLNIDDAIDTAGTLTATAGTGLDINASITTTGAQRYSATTYTLSDNTQTLSSDDTLSFLGSGALSLGGTGAGWILDTALLNASTSANGLYVGDANTTDIVIESAVSVTNASATETLILTGTGNLTQSASLSANKLALLLGGDATLTNSSNSIGTFAATLKNLSLTNSGALTIGSVNPTGITASGNVSITATDLKVTEAVDIGTNTLTLTLSGAGSDSSNGKLIAKSLLLNGTGSYTFDGSSNDVDTLAANSGAITFGDSDDLTIGTVGSTTGLTSTGAIVLTSGTSLNIDDAIDTAGTLTATAGTGLDISASIATTGAQRYSATTYTLSDNTQTLSSDDTLSFLGSGALSLGGTGAGWSLDTALLNASTSANGLYVGDANTTDIVIESAVSVTNASATETLILTGTGNLTQSASLSANKLALLLGGDATLTNSSNSIGTFAATLKNLSLTNSGALTIGSVNPTGITASGNVSITATDLKVTEAVDIGTNTLTLTLSGAGSDSSNGKLIAKSLLLNGTGSYTFDGSSNDVDTLAANSGAITFGDSDDLTIGTVGSTTGLTSTGAIVLTSGTSLNIDDAIDTAGTLTATAGTGLDISASIATTGAQRYSATTYTLSDNTQTLSSDDTLSFLGSGALSLGGTGAGWSLDTALLNASTSANGLYVGDANTTDIVIESAVSVTNASATETLILTGTGGVSQTAAITADELAVYMSGQTSLTNGNNAIEKFAGSASSLTLRNMSMLTITTVNGTDGFEAVGPVDIATHTNNLVIDGVVSGSSVKLNAGSDKLAGDASGGNLVITESAQIRATNGAITGYTGSVAGSQTVINEVGTGSNRFRYGSDEAFSKFNSSLASLSSSGWNLIFRESPVISVTVDDQNSTFGQGLPELSFSLEGYQNGDTSESDGTDVKISGYDTKVGIYVLAASATSNFGYSFAYSDATLNVLQPPPVINTTDATSSSGSAVSPPGTTTAEPSPSLDGLSAGSTVIESTDSTQPSSGTADTQVATQTTPSDTTTSEIAATETTSTESTETESAATQESSPGTTSEGASTSNETSTTNTESSGPATADTATDSAGTQTDTTTETEPDEQVASGTDINGAAESTASETSADTSDTAEETSAVSQAQSAETTETESSQESAGSAEADTTASDATDSTNSTESAESSETTDSATTEDTTGSGTREQPGEETTSESNAEAESADTESTATESSESTQTDESATASDATESAETSDSPEASSSDNVADSADTSTPAESVEASEAAQTSESQAAEATVASETTSLENSAVAETNAATAAPEQTAGAATDTAQTTTTSASQDSTQSNTTSVAADTAASEPTAGTAEQTATPTTADSAVAEPATAGEALASGQGTGAALDAAMDISESASPAEAAATEQAFGDAIVEALANGASLSDAVEGAASTTQALAAAAEKLSQPKTAGDSAVAALSGDAKAAALEPAAASNLPAADAQAVQEAFDNAMSEALASGASPSEAMAAANMAAESVAQAVTAAAEPATPAQAASSALGGAGADSLGPQSVDTSNLSSSAAQGVADAFDAALSDALAMGMDMAKAMQLAEQAAATEAEFAAIEAARMADPAMAVMSEGQNVSELLTSLVPGGAEADAAVVESFESAMMEALAMGLPMGDALQQAIENARLINATLERLSPPKSDAEQAGAVISGTAATADLLSNPAVAEAILNAVASGTPLVEAISEASSRTPTAPETELTPIERLLAEGGDPVALVESSLVLEQLTAEERRVVLTVFENGLLESVRGGISLQDAIIANAMSALEMRARVLQVRMDQTEMDQITISAAKGEAISEQQLNAFIDSLGINVEQ